MSEDKRKKHKGTNAAKRTYQPKHAAASPKPEMLFGPPLLRSVLIAAAAAVVFNIMFGIAIVSGTSMEPALLEGDVILFWKLTNAYKRGQIVLIKTNGSTDYVKRIYAVPGDMLERGGDSELFLINGEVPDEPYIYEETCSKTEISYPLAIGSDEYFVMGDHRGDSFDSRNYGAVTVKQIDGRALIIFRGGL